MAIGSIGQRFLVKLVNKLGAEQASRALGVGQSLLMRFIEGKTPVPDPVLLKAIDYLLDEEVVPPVVGHPLAGTKLNKPPLN